MDNEKNKKIETDGGIPVGRSTEKEWKELMDLHKKSLMEEAEEDGRNPVVQWIVNVGWWFYRLWHNGIAEFPHKVKFLFQRIFRGYGDDELWSLDDTFTTFILPRLKAFRRMNRAGVPGCIAHNDKSEGLKDSVKKWDEILDKMIWAFEHSKNYYDPADGHIPDKKEREELGRKFEEGMRLFAEYYANLWD